METEYRQSMVPEKRVWIFILLRHLTFVSPHTSLAGAVREAQALQGARHLQWTASSTKIGAETWIEKQGGWEIRHCQLDP